MNLRTWNLGGMIFLVSISAILISGCGGSSDEEKVQRAIGKAETFYKAGLFKEALAHYQEALAIQPTDAAILLAMGQTYEALSLNRDALGSYDEAIRFDSRLEQAYRQKALLLIKDGKIEEVDKLVAGIEAKKEMEGLVPFLKGEVARSRNDWSGALEFYQAADRLRPGSRETQYALAEAYQRTGKPEDAINLLEQMLRTNPAEFMAAGQLSTIYQNRGETGKAIQILTQTSQASPQLAPLRSALADLLLTSNRDEEASKEVQEALKLDPDDAMGLYVRGRLSLKKGDAASALKDLEGAIKRRPEEESFRRAYREAQVASGEVVEKVKVVSQKIQKQGETPALLLELADACLYQGEPEQALRSLEKVLAQQPESQNAHILEALAYLSLGRSKQAEESLGHVKNHQDVRYIAIDGIIRRDPNQVSQATEKLKGASATEVWAGYFRALALLYSGQFGPGLEELDRLMQQNETFGAGIYEMARVYIELNEPHLALALYQRLMEVYPESQKPILLSARALVRIGHLERAKILLDSVLKKDPDSQPALFLLGTLHLQDKNFKEGARIFAALIDSPTTNAKDRMFYRGVLAKTLVYDRQYKQALEQYNKLITEAPSQSATYIEKALAEMALGQDQEALATCQAGIQATTDTQTLRVVQSVLLQQAGKVEEGIQALEAAVPQLPKDPGVQYRLVPIRVSLLASGGKYDQAREVIKGSGYPSRLVDFLLQSVEEVEKNKTDLRGLSLALLFSFYQWPDAALTLYTDLSDQNPQDKLLLAYLGDAQTLAGRLEDAHRTYSKALQSDPNDAYFLQKRGAVSARLRKYDEAVQDLSSALAVTPEDSALHFQIGSLYESQKLNQDAIESYRTVVRLNNNPALVAGATNNLAWLLSQDEKTLPEALESAKKAFELAVPNPRTGLRDGNVLDTVGWVYFLSGQADEGRKLIEQALSILPNQPTINYHLGRIFEGTGQPKIAVVQYSKALDFDPEFPEADDARLRATRLATELGQK